MSETAGAWPFLIQALQIVVVPLIALIGKQLSDMRKEMIANNKELTQVRERLAHIEGALGVTTRGATRDHAG